MHIKFARPFSEFVKLPARAVVDPRLGKGEIVTLAKIALYLQGDQKPLEGTTADFCAVLGIEPRVFQMHLPTLGSSGCLRCDRPQRGFWVLYCLVFDPLDSVPASETLGAKEAREAKKISPPVVVSPISSLNKKNSYSEKKSRTEGATTTSGSSLLGGEGGGNDAKNSSQAKKLSHDAKINSLPDELKALLDKMPWVGEIDPVQEAFEQDPDFVWGWANYWTSPERTVGVQKPGALFRLALEGDIYPPAQYMPAQREEIAEAVEYSQQIALQRAEDTPEQKLWRKTLRELELQMTAATYETHLSRTTLLEIDGSNLIVEVPNDYVAGFLKNRLYERIQKAVANNFGIPASQVNVEFVVEEQSNGR